MTELILIKPHKHTLNSTSGSDRIFPSTFILLLKNDVISQLALLVSSCASVCVCDVHSAEVDVVCVPRVTLHRDTLLPITVTGQ